jgi:multimeric flavodoxin WrbA
MKILALSFSPREQGNTELLLDQVLQGARQHGADIELYRTADKDIRPCDACGVCFKSGECPIQDDMQEVYAKMLEADGIVFGSPVYFYNITAQGKAVIDRTLALGHSGRTLANKTGGIVVVGGSLGLIDAVKDLYFYMIVHQMLPANFIAAYSSNKGDVKRLEKCMSAAADLGKQLVKIVEKGFTYPEDVKANHIGYGTHTW